MESDYVPPQHRLNAFNCPHCGAFANQRWQLKVDSGETERGGLSRRLADTASFCDTCHKFTLWESTKMIYPQVCPAPLASHDTPQTVIEEYEEARAIFSQSPRGSAALLRLAIQKPSCGFLKSSATGSI